MSLLRAFAWRVASLFRGRTLDARLSEEIDLHLEMQVAENVRRGMMPEVARTAALRAFGGVGQARELYRDAHGFAWLDALRQDLLYTRRTLARSPGFLFVAVLVMGLAIGANTSLFTFFNGYVLKPLPIPNASLNFEIYCARVHGNYDHLWSYSDFRQIRDGNNTLSDVYAYAEHDVPMLDPEPYTAHARWVSGNYFAVLGGRTILGRPLGPSDDEVPGRDAVLVLSHAAWTRMFHGDAFIVGKTVRIRQRVFTIVGVSDPAFSGTSPVTPDVWLPLTMSDAVIPNRPLANPDAGAFFVGGLLKAGVSPQPAHDSLLGLARSVNSQHPAASAIEDISLYPRATYVPMRPDILAVAIPVFSLFGLVLLIACADLANLLLARAAARQREISVRLALGASRRRLVAQFLTESLTLAACGATIGYLLARTGITALQGYMFSIYAKLGFSIQPLTLDWRVFLYTAVVAVAAGVAFGLAPALEATKADLARGLKQEGASIGLRSRPRRLTDVLVTAQVAASMILLVLAGLLIQNAQRVAGANTGYDLDALVDVRLDGSKAKLIDRLKADARFSSMTEVWRTPLYGNLNQLPAVTEGRAMTLGYSYVDDHYFETLSIPLLQGRNFIRQELSADARVAIISEGTAHRLWSNATPLGKVFQVGAPRPGERFTAGTFQVIGVVKDVTSGGFYLGRDLTSVYFPATAGDPRNNGLIARVQGSAPQAVTGLRRICTEIDRSSSCDPLTMREVAWMQVFPYRIAGSVASGVGLLALALTCVGLYGVVAFAVVQRTREIGIRMALGAGRVSVVGLVLRRSARQVALGVAIGIPFCLALSTYTASVIPMLKTFDLAAYILTPPMFVAVAMAASYLPARRATAVDPMVVLRDE